MGIQFLGIQCLGIVVLFVRLLGIAVLFVRALHCRMRRFPGGDRLGVKRTEIFKFGGGEGFSVAVGNDDLPAFARPYPRFRDGYEDAFIPALRFLVVSFGGHLVSQWSAPYRTRQLTLV
jgi:hypothetical protein